mmetsp:Transcript_34763/g.71729  ORF Transcript_34763/g.71729 Transcript_34763/m.71729 type:complete len:162 (-) Transcript_34763:14-499(-)
MAAGGSGTAGRKAGDSSIMAGAENPIAVIGASRGTGLQCIMYIAKQKLHCRAISRDPVACEKAVSSKLPANLRIYVTYQKADVTEPKSLPPALRGCRGVIFAATATAGWRLPFYEYKDTPPHVDFEGCVAAANAAAAQGVSRFVLISSLSITRPSHPMHMV